MADDPCDGSGDEASEAALDAPIGKDAVTETEGCRRALT